MEYEVETLKSLPKLNEQKKNPKKPIGEYIFHTVLVLLFTAVLSFSGQVIYDEVRYAPFIVDGESMYPTLNYNTTVISSNGEKYQDAAQSWSLGDFSDASKTYVVDYCYMDSSKKTLNNLERFDIVVTYYKTDYDSNSKLKDSASLKVKRVIGLPGETVKFTEDGSLYIKEKGGTEFSYVEQSFLTYENYKKSRPLVDETWYEKAMKETTRRTLITELGEDEYYVVGDNRRSGCSKDSRDTSIGPIKQSYLVGKAVTIAMKAKYVPGSSPKKMYLTYNMPWNLEIL